MKRSIARAAGFAHAAALAAILAGCAAPAQKENMAVVAPAPTAAPMRQLPYTVRVETKGGQETGATDSSNIGNADLKAAIEASITKSQLFKSVVQGQGGEYELTVTITRLDKPLFGASFTVTLETGWSLVRVSDKQPVLRKGITSSYTAGLGDSLVGVTRLRLAVEGAVRNNIEDGLKAISAAPI